MITYNLAFSSPTKPCHGGPRVPTGSVVGMTWPDGLASSPPLESAKVAFHGQPPGAHDAALSQANGSELHAHTGPRWPQT